MVAFGEKLAAEKHGLWAERSAYLNYGLLKSKIEAILEAKNNEDAEVGRVVDALKNAFQGSFDDEMVKILAFYDQQRDILLHEVAELEKAVDCVPQEVQNNEDLTPDERLNALDELTERLQNGAKDCQRLLQYVSLNMQGMRKILKKFAKNVDPTPPLPGYLALSITSPHDKGWKILQGTYLKPEVQNDLDSMIEHKQLTQSARTIRQLSSQLSEYRHTILAASSHDLQEVELRRDLLRMDTLLAEMRTAEEDAGRNAACVQGSTWAARAGIFEKAPIEEHAVATTMGIAINCFNSALYMSNYNLLVPSVRSFLFHIGSLPTAAGLVIGCCDLASMPSTVGYSLWTNRVYKLPLIFSGIACLVGNLILVVSYDSGSITLLYIARLVTGIGAARCISRRYIADFVKKSQRTSASAAFVGSSALGMALGPLMARIFQAFPTTRWHGITFDSITMGAWTMTALWVVFILVAAVFFEDPMVKVRASKDALRRADNEQPLLPGVNGESAATAGGRDKRSLFRRPSFMLAFGPTLVTVYALLVLKTCQQAYLDSLPLTTAILFDWTDGNAGVYVAVLCLSMLLVTFAMGWLATRGVSDRMLCLFSLTLMLVGCGQLFFGGFPRWNYFTGGTAILVATIICEGSFMSLESKIIHPAFAEGTWNAGLLSTEAGTMGRFTGNLLLSVAGSITGLHDAAQVTKFAKVLWAAVAAIVLSNLGLFMLYFKRIATLE